MKHDPNSSIQKLVPEGKPIHCFVCGKQQATINDLKEHMHTMHVPEKEYIICQQCGIPIRDVKTHYRVHHKASPIQSGPLKVEIMYEWDSARKTIGKASRKKRTSWQEGHFFSEKNQRMMHYRSSWEKKVMVLLEASPRVDSYQEEPFPIQYEFRGGTHNYFPDFLVKFKNGTSLILEIKPQNQCETDINKAKWSSAMRYCTQHGFVFRIWTEVMISKLNKIARNPMDLTEAIMCA